MKKRSSLKGCIQLACVLLVLPGIILATTGIVWWQSIDRWARRAAHAEGIVVALVGGNGSSSPIVEYSDAQGQQHRYQSTISTNPPAYSVGDIVQILYERDRPASAAINHWLFLYFFPIFLGGFAVVNFVCVGGLYVIAMLVFMLVGNREDNTAETSGQTSGYSPETGRSDNFVP